MMKKYNIALFFVCLLVCFSCSESAQKRFKIKIDNSSPQISIHRFDRDVFALDTNNIASGIPNLEKKYGSFFNLYTQHIMQLGSIDSASFIPTFRLFLTDSVFRNVYQESLTVFDDVSEIEKKITVAFQYIKHYFPEKKIPEVYMHVSGFNQSVVVADNILSLSIDNYLGADYVYYQDLVYSYQLNAMVKEKAPSDMIMGWLLSEFPMKNYSDRLLDNILYRGKILFLIETFMPTEKEEMLMAYTPEQLKWCYKNQKQMWIAIAEQKHLFLNDRMTSAKYINEAPFTAYFTQESPGRAGIWIGWQIIRSYMKNNKNITLRELMNNENYQQILEQSGYKP